MGKPLGPVNTTGTSDKTGTIITFKPDDTIFNLTTEYNYEILESRLRELAFLNKGIRLTITDQREKDDSGEYKGTVFHSQKGLSEFVEFVDANREKLIEKTIHIDTEKEWSTSRNSTSLQYIFLRKCVFLCE